MEIYYIYMRFELFYLIPPAPSLLEEGAKMSYYEPLKSHLHLGRGFRG
jgi:hypothetical protein